MSLNPDIRDRAYQFFIEEAQELLQVIEQGLLNLHQDRSTPKVHELMRAAHSIKGGAASVELGAIELLAHRLEDFFKALYSDEVEFDAELENLLLQGYDCLSHPLLEQIEVGSFDREAALLAAEPVFTALEARLEAALKNSDSYIPSSSDLGVDIVASIFEVDVAQAIEHLQTVAANPTNYDPVAELQGQLEMLAGFAELFNLSGFDDIVRTARSALATNPDRVLEIIKAVVADCSIARTMVLEGDRQQGGRISPALQKLAHPDSDSPQEAIESAAEDELLDSFWSTLPTSEPLAEEIFNPVTVSEPVANEPKDEPLDSLWSSLPTSETLGEEIFNSVTESDSIASEPEDEQLDSLWSTLPTSEPLAEEIFNPLTESDSPEEPIATTSDSVPPTADRTQTELSAAIAAIEHNFDSLPSAELPISLPAKTTPTPAQTTQPAAATRKLSVKVDLDRLEKMNNLVGELTINRNSLALQNQQLQENVFELNQKFLRFGEITKRVRDLSDRMLVEQRWQIDSSPKSDRHTPNDAVEEASQFDSLEMDTYNVLDSSLQEILEEIIQLEESVSDITIFAQQSDRTINDQRQMLDRMRNELVWVRMLPLEQILQRFPRILRDLSNKYHKPVELQLTGTDVLVDRAVLEKLSDPLLHLLRNSFDHGIEEPEVRQQQGKPAMGLIQIQAYYQANQTVIEVKDDGRGLDLAKIARRGIERGLISAEEASGATPERLFELIFEPGFSTASQVSEISGRGVGMSIVRSQIETLKGKVSVASTVGSGTSFTMRLPLTLTIAKLLICSLGATTVAIPSDSIEEIIVPTAEQIELAHQQKLLSFDRQLIPIYSLKEIWSYNCPIPTIDNTDKAFKTIEPPEDWLAPLLLLRRGTQLFALEVVSLLSEQELVIKPYGKAIAAPPYSYGCTILGDGSLIPVCDGSAAIATILDEPDSQLSSNASENSFSEESLKSTSPDATKTLAGDGYPEISRKTIMVVDDSTTLRRTMTHTLEKQGYRVIQRQDGQDALNGFKQHPDLDLIICDLEMPVMNGLEFLGMRRRDAALAEIPTFVLTSRGGTKHHNLAMQLGADGYFIKPYVETEFVAEVKKILADRPQPQAIAMETSTILVIDDSSALRRTLALSLENKGYGVLQARDGAEGLEILRNHLQTDLVICDLEMPVMNGFEFLTVRRREPQLADIPVFMLTSRNTDKHRALANSLGAAEFFTKPYVEERFLQNIAEFLHQR